MGNLVFVSGQLPLDLEGKVPVGIEVQTRQALANVAAVLEQAGASTETVAKMAVYLRQLRT